MASNKGETFFPKLEKITRSCITQIESNLSTAIHKETPLKLDGFSCRPLSEVVSQSTETTTLIEFELSGEFTGKLLLMMPYGECAIISGLMLDEDTETIRKHTGIAELPAANRKAFDSFGAQVATGLDTVIRNAFPKDDDTHVTFIKSHMPPIQQTINNILALNDDDEIFGAHNKCYMLDTDENNISLLLSVNLAERFYGESVIVQDVRPVANVIAVAHSKHDVNLMKKYLRNTGYFLHSQIGQDGAVLKLQRLGRNVNLIFLDLDFGKDSAIGLSIYRRIRCNSFLESTPIIVYSSRPTKKLVQDALKIGIADFLVVPFKEETFISKVQKYLASCDGGNLG